MWFSVLTDRGNLFIPIHFAGKLSRESRQCQLLPFPIQNLTGNFQTMYQRVLDQDMLLMPSCNACMACEVGCHSALLLLLLTGVARISPTRSQFPNQVARLSIYRSLHLVTIGHRLLSRWGKLALPRGAVAACHPSCPTRALTLLFIANLFTLSLV